MSSSASKSSYWWAFLFSPWVSFWYPSGFYTNQLYVRSLWFRDWTASWRSWRENCFFAVAFTVWRLLQKTGVFTLGQWLVAHRSPAPVFSWSNPWAMAILRSISGRCSWWSWSSESSRLETLFQMDTTHISYGIVWLRVTRHLRDSYGRNLQPPLETRNWVFHMSPSSIHHWSSGDRQNRNLQFWFRHWETGNSC